MPAGGRPYPNDPPGSTKNVMGNAPARGGNDPFAYVKLTGDHAYLGHFRKDKFIEEGHNVKKLRGKVSVSTAGSAPILTVTNRRGKEHTFVGQSGERGLNRLGRRTAKRAIKAGGPAGAAVAVERPVLAAKIAAREAGVGRKERRSMIREARQSPESARSERRARRGKATSARAAAASGRGY